MMARVGFSSFITLLSVFCLPGAINGQVIDDFSDGNFDQLPTWTSSQLSGKADYTIVEGRLRSDGPSATNSIWVSTSGSPTFINGNLTWQFDVEYDQAPSGSNNIRIYFGSDNEDLSDTPTGYYIQLGESGSDDGIDFYKTTSTHPLISDPEPSVSESVDLTIRLTRSEMGQWTLYKGERGSNDFLVVGIITDAEIGISDHFGFLVNHTSSRNDSFFFDNVMLPFPDDIPPSLLDVTTSDQQIIVLEFSEELERISAENPVNYFLASIGNPTSVGLNLNTVMLSFSDSFVNATNYELSITNLEDINGNVLASTKTSLFYFQQPELEPRDIIISEILADPDPPNDLPTGEFVEIFNRSNKVFNLNGWRLSDLSSSSVLGEVYIFPNEYWIICSEENIDEYITSGKTMGLKDLPTLNNGGDVIALTNELNQTSDSLRYDLSWYRSSDKQDGGWSLEIIDLTNDCVQQANWVASEDFRGGTPGEQNSVFAEKPDLTEPMVLSVLALNPDTISAFFDEILDESSIAQASYSITPEVRVDSIIITEDLKELKIVLSEPLQPGISYNVSLSGIRDCPGNQVTPQEISFALIEEADIGDVILNEILFDPYPNGADFVEVYNTSKKYINLRGWFLGNREANGDSLFLTNLKKITSENLILPPQDYLAFTIQDNLRDFYFSIDEKRVFLVESMPSMPNDEGSISLIHPDSILMGAYNYQDDFHFDLLADREGVSLERISPVKPTNESSNWTSSASTAGFATPGRRNSQSVNRTALSSSISIEPQVIIPDGSGQNDFATINYQFDRPGKVANVRIYDTKGREVITLADNETLSSEGFFIWDGLDGKGAKVRTGYYVVYFEVFDTSGSVTSFKEKVVVGSLF
ncbi:MAG: lamin tail domain-containing protein [Bacteroidota bacterium]